MKIGICRKIQRSWIRFWSHVFGDAEYVVNTNTGEVHCIDTQMKQCQIETAIAHKNITPIDTLDDAHSLGYDNCAYCIGGSKR